MGIFKVLLTALACLSLLKASRMNKTSLFVSNGEPMNIAVKEGELASFSCLLTHEVTYSIDWMFNLSYVTTHGSLKVIDNSKYNTTVDGPAKGEMLFVNQVSKADEGFYRCVVSANGTSKLNSSDGYLTVIPIPTLRHVPSNQTVVEGDNVTLHCTLENFDALYFFVSWFWNKVNISRNYKTFDEPDFIGEYSIQGNTSLGLKFDLQVWKISRTSAGHFQCRVYSKNNHHLIVQSYPANVDVLYPPKSKYPVCEPLSMKDYYREGEVINTTCSVKGGNGPVFLRWTQGPNWSMEEGTLGVEQDSTDAILKKSWTLTAEHDGRYIVCSMRGDAILKEQQCLIGPLSIHYNPIVSIFFTNASRLNIGENATYSCSMKSNPITNTTDYLWIVNGDKISESEKFMIAMHEDRSVLTIYNLTERDENSVITCHAGIDGSPNASTILRLQTPIATPETQTSLRDFTFSSSGTSSSTHITVQHFNGASSHVNALHFAIAPVVVLIIVVIFGIVVVCKKVHRRQRASRDNMEPAEQELQPADPVKLEEVDSKAEHRDVHVESSFISGPGEQLNIYQLGEMNTPERNSLSNDSTGLEVTGAYEKRFRNVEGLLYTELDFHEKGFSTGNALTAPTPLRAKMSVTTYATLQFDQSSTDFKR